MISKARMVGETTSLPKLASVTEWISEPERLASYEEYAGPRPDASDYMPDWPEAERTHYQMYENTSEGTPISPVMATPEDLCVVACRQRRKLVW